MDPCLANKLKGKCCIGAKLNRGVDFDEPDAVHSSSAFVSLKQLFHYQLHVQSSYWGEWLSKLICDASKRPYNYRESAG